MFTLKPGSHDSISIKAKQKAKQRNEVILVIFSSQVPEEKSCFFSLLMLISLVSTRLNSPDYAARDHGLTSFQPQGTQRYKS